MEKKEFAPGIPEYTDTSDCGLTTERRTFEAELFESSIKVIRRFAHSTRHTDITGIEAASCELDCEVIRSVRNVAKVTLIQLFNELAKLGYTYSKDKKVLMYTFDATTHIVSRFDMANVCKFATDGYMDHEIMRSVINIIPKEDFSDQLYRLMTEYAMG